MASLYPSSKKQGRMLRRVDFIIDGGRRYRIKLGQVTGREGDDFRRRIEEVIGDLRLGRQHSSSLIDWLNSLSPKVQTKLEQVGLMKASRKSSMTLGELLDSIVADADVKSSTLTTYGHTVRCLSDFFGRGRPLDSISHADALKYKDEYLRSPTAAYGARPLSPATVGRRVMTARQFFKIALDKEVIAKNPFIGVKGGHQTNKKRQVFVEENWVTRMIAATDDPDWKILLTLGRYLGLRMPSEVIELRWKHVDFIHDSILIHSGKTEHHVGKVTRHVPIFDSIREVLWPQYVKGVDPEDFVIQNPNYRNPKANLRTQFKRIAEDAGVTPWPKPFHNMRATRETELIEQNDIATACEMIGNCEMVALLHYQMTRPKFLSSAIERDREARKGAQNRAQKFAEMVGKERKAREDVSRAEIVSSATVPSYPSASGKCLSIQDLDMGDEGFEPPTLSV